jgi:hypothetical protein
VTGRRWLILAIVALVVIVVVYLGSTQLQPA